MPVDIIQVVEYLGLHICKFTNFNIDTYIHSVPKKASLAFGSIMAKVHVVYRTEN